MSTVYCLRVKRLESLRWRHTLHSRVPDLYVEANLRGIIRRTRTVEKSSAPIWDEHLVYSSGSPDESEMLQIQVKHNSSWSMDPTVGAVSVRLADLLAKCQHGEVTLRLSSSDRNMTDAPGHIVLHLEITDTMESADLSIKTAIEDVRKSNIAHLGEISGVSELIRGQEAQLNDQSGLYRSVGKLLETLGVFQKAINVLSEVHPFVSIAWSLASALHTAVQNVFKTDQRIIQLVCTMDDAFSFVHDVQSLRNKAASLQQPIINLLKQTIECCLFIRQYTSRSFLRRMLDIDSAQKLDDFERSLSSFKQQIDSGVILHTAFVSMRKAEEIDDLFLCQRLNPTLSDSFDRPVCLPDTRVEIRNRIMGWLFSETKQNIFWLYGAAGCGKSTVASTIVENLRDMSRLGAFLVFERGKSEPSTIIRTIAYQLALFDSSIGANVLTEVKNDKGITMASSSVQFGKLLLQPLTDASSSIQGPVVVVLDALDECGTPDTRRSLMRLFRKEFPNLPNTFRFLITSRQEADIDKVLSSQPEEVHAVELDYTSEASHRDVLAYIRTEMHSVVREEVDVPDGWPWDESMASLGRAASGLFIWASTAIKLVSTSDNPFRSLKELVSDSRSLANFGLYALYSTALLNSGIAWTNATSRTRFAQVFALVLLSKVPLSGKTIDGVLGFPPEESSFLILSRLRSLLSYSPGGPVSLFHASFVDYLTSPERATDPWFVDIPAAKSFILGQCCSLMDNMLHFNMCDLTTSFLRNDDIPGLEDRVKARIPPHLEYACIYWPQHLFDVPCSFQLLERLSHFAYEQLLFWFEVLSLVKVFGRVASRTLLDIAAWIEVHDADIASFLRDASMLAGIFTSSIMQSTPHIYVSMLPLSESESEVAAHYSKQLCRKARVDCKGIRRPPMCLKVLEGHSAEVWSVAVSPDGSRIASSSRDKTIRVWDISTGETVLGPLLGHSDAVCCVNFSPDGRYLISGSLDCTVGLWDASSGNLRHTLEGHRGKIRALDISPDGRRIVSGSDDKTIIVWDADVGTVLAGPLSGHIGEVCSVLFSLDGTQFVSGSVDGSVMLWSAEGAKLCPIPFEHNFRNVFRIAFSRDGKRLVRGSDNGTVENWDVESGSLIFAVHGHMQVVMAVAYSACGTRIASGSWDRRIVPWDAEVGRIISSPFEGHMGDIYSVKFSPDGERIVSGSGDSTVRIWDVTSKATFSTTSMTYTTSVTALMFAGDGNHVISASDDGLITHWDVRDGTSTPGTLFDSPAEIHSVFFTPQGSHFVSASNYNTIVMRDDETGRCVYGPLRGVTDDIAAIALSPDGTHVVAGTYDHKIHVWNLVSGELVAGPLVGHSNAIMSMSFSPDGRRLVSGSDDKTVRIWDTGTWSDTLGGLTGPNGQAIVCVCFSPDSTQIASGAEDGAVIIRNADTGRILHGPFSGHCDTVLCIMFSLDGKYIISGSLDTSIQIWDVAREQYVIVLEGHTSGVQCLALSPDGTKIASGSDDTSIRIWDVSDFLQPRPNNEDSVTGVSQDWVLLDNGWVVDGRNWRDLLVWIPPDLRRTLWSPRNLNVLSCEFSTKLDLRGAALGARWTDCFSRTLEY